MRKFIRVGLILSVLFTPTIVSKAAAPPSTHIFLDQSPIKQVDTYKLNQVVYVEAKPLLLADGFQFIWDVNSQTVQLDREGISALVTMNSAKAMLNNKQITLNSVVMLRAGIVYISVDDLATLMGKELVKSINAANLYYKSSLKDLIYKALNDTKSTYAYEGRLLNNQRSGIGKLYKDGVLLYEGFFSDHMLNGYGKLYMNGKLLVEGGFSANEPDGNATYHMANGEIYEGAFLAGRMTGRGLLYRGKILLYDGNWLDGKMSGVGVVYDSSSQITYSGSLKNNIPDGYGIQFVNGKKQYQGGWIEGHKQGQGMLFNKDGQLKYMGSFVNDQMEGLGASVGFHMSKWVSEGPNNQIISEEKETATITYGSFVNDKLIRATSMIKYTGDLDVNKIPNGVGSFYSSNGLTSSRLGTLNAADLIYVGAVKEAKRDGLGKAYVNNQLVYDGAFSDDVRSGKGKEYVGGQLVYDGNWNTDIRSGAGKIFEYFGNNVDFSGIGSVIFKEVDYLLGRVRSTKHVRKYTGDIVNGELTGTGSLYELDSSSVTSYFTQTGVLVFKGKFANGSRVGNGIEYMGSSIIFEGNYNNDLRDGLGREYVNGILTYEGSYAKGKKDGMGRLYVDNSLVYEGYFKEDKKNGYGKAIKNNVVTFEGEFVNDIQQ
jgi:hypothetical protein